jgi:hypothetical protein
MAFMTESNSIRINRLYYCVMNLFPGVKVIWMNFQVFLVSYEDQLLRQDNFTHDTYFPIQITENVIHKSKRNSNKRGSKISYNIFTEDFLNVTVN